MSDTHEQKDGQMADLNTGQQPDVSGLTIADICRETGKVPDNVGRAWRRAHGKGLVSRPFAFSLIPTPHECRAVSALNSVAGAGEKSKAIKAPVKAVAVAQPRAVAATQPTAEDAKPKAAQPAEWPMWAIMLACTLATVQNMATVTGNVFNGDMWASWTLTALLSAVPFVVSLQKSVSTPAKALVAALVVVEMFCNMTRIYAGLTNFDTPGYMGYPTRFLGMVTDMLGSGTYPTARVLGASIALIVAGIFAVSFHAINKKKA
jgi:hypothetical protein